MNETIIRFLDQQTCATLCCINEEGKPYCFTCFYAFNSEEGLLYFKSSANSNHSLFLINNPAIAGTILPDKLNTILVKGVQFEGILLEEDHPLTKRSSVNYLKRHPMSMAIPGETRTVQINHIKMTDSSKGFGKKITWNREQLKESTT